MNYSSEKVLESNFARIIEGKGVGGACIKLLSTISGLPDRLVLVPHGRVFFVEFKSRGQRPRTLQAWWHTRLTRMGFEVFIVDSEESYNTVIQHAISGG